jgi:hypothetical protein
MISDKNIPNQNISEARPKGKLPVAIILGLLTFVVSPIVAVVTAAIFFFVGKISENFNPIMNIAGILGLRELGGFFAAYFILIGFIALLGDFITAIISWFINRSKKFATITFVSAIIFQCVLVAIVLPMTIKDSQETMRAGIESEKSYQQFAKIGNASFDVQEPYPDAEIGNRHPEHGPVYKKLLIVVPVSVSQAGVYQVHVRYSFSKAGESGSTRINEATETFGVGEHTMKVEFLADGTYGFWSPASVGGTVDILLTYLASEKELLDKITSGINPDSAIDKMVHKQILKDVGLDTREAKTHPTINKFIERKEVHF